MRYHIWTKYTYKDGHNKVLLLLNYTCFLLSNGVWYIKQSSKVFKITSILSEISLEIGQRWSLSTVRASAERPFLKEVFRTHTQSYILSRSVSAATESRIEARRYCRDKTQSDHRPGRHFSLGILPAEKTSTEISLCVSSSLITQITLLQMQTRHKILYYLYHPADIQWSKL